jgi:hypothetical protein
VTDEGRVVSLGSLCLCIGVSSVMDALSTPSLPPCKNASLLRDTAAPFLDRAFLDRAFQLRCRLLKACVSDLSDLSDLSDTRSGNRGGSFIFVRTDGTLGTSGTCGTRLRRSRKDFFYPLKRRAGAAPQKISRKRVSHSVNLCPISLISPISPRNAPAAPFECPSQFACR